MERPGKDNKLERKHPFLHELIRETDDTIRIRSGLTALLVAGRDIAASFLSCLLFASPRSPNDIAELRVEVDKLEGRRLGFVPLE